MYFYTENCFKASHKAIIPKIDYISIYSKIITTSLSLLVIENKQEDVTRKSANEKDNFLKDLPDLMFHNLIEDYMMTEQNFIINYLHKRHFPKTPSHFDNNVIVSNTALTNNNDHHKEQSFRQLQNHGSSTRFLKKEYTKSIEDSS